MVQEVAGVIIINDNIDDSGCKQARQGPLPGVAGLFRGLLKSSSLATLSLVTWKLE